MRSLASALTRDQWLLFLNNLLWGFGGSLYLYIQPIYLSELKASPEQIGIALGLSGLVVTLGYVPLGMWADRFGRKALMMTGWAVAVASTVVMALAPDWRMFTGAYAVYYLCNFALPAFQAYIVTSATPRSRQRVISTLYAGYWVGSILSPAIGGGVGEQFGLRAVYLCAAAMYGLATITFIPLRDQPVERMAATGNLKQLWRNPPFLWQIAFIFILFFVLNLGTVMMPKFLGDMRGYSLGQIGQLGTVGVLGVATLTWLLGRLSGERNTALILCQLAAIVALTTLLMTGAVVPVAAGYFLGGGHYLVRPIVVGRLARTLEAASMSLGFSIYQTAIQAALSISPYVAGLLYARDPAWPMIAGIGGITLTLLFTVIRPMPAPAPTQTQVELQ